MTRLAAVFAALAVALPALAQSPLEDQIPFQGVLSDGGVPVPDGTRTIGFALTYDDGSPTSWSETAPIATTRGVFSHRLGSVNHLSGVDFSKALNLTVVVDPGSNQTLLGPTPLGAVPRSQASQVSEDLEFPVSGSATTSFGDGVVKLRGFGDGAGLLVRDSEGNGIEVGFTILSPPFRRVGPDGDGVRVVTADQDGVRVLGAGAYGVQARGDTGNRLVTSSTASLAPDIVLGGTEASVAGDDGVIASDPDYTGSDLLLSSRDAVAVFLDTDDNESGDFEVWNGAGVRVWAVGESGVVTNRGATLTADAAVQIDDPTAPASRTLTLPSTVGPERLVAFSGTAVTDGTGTAAVRLPDYTEAVAGGFRYQLTAIGRFAQAIVGQKVEGNRFTIRTSEPGVEVSWRVEGVRRDAWATANARPAVEAKDGMGYLHPDAHGRSAAESLAPEADGPSQLTAEGQAALDREAERQRIAVEHRKADAFPSARRE